MSNKKQNSFKSFIIELIKKKTKVEQRRDQPSLKSFIVELMIFTALVLSYYFLVLVFLADWLKRLFDQSKPTYAVVALALIATQGVVLEVISAALMKIVELKIK
jgi:hypothetical protein